MGAFVFRYLLAERLSLAARSIRTCARFEIKQEHKREMHIYGKWWSRAKEINTPTITQTRLRRQDWSLIYPSAHNRS
jgi:hypothetical protein